MSSLAEILISQGKTVSGSDAKASELTAHLEKTGIKVYIGQCAENITPELDLIVYTAAISEDNEELIAARNSNATVIDRAELVGMLMLTYKYPVSVAGTHGKTTTSSILTEIFMAADTDPTISLGGILPSIGGNFRIGSKDYFLLETCEYCDSFLKFNPHSAIILNVDKDHTDYFTGLEHIYRSFNSFAKRLPKGGTLVINSDIKDMEKLTADVQADIVTYGSTKNADWTAEDITFNEFGFGSYTAYHRGVEVAKISLNIPGIHNVYNSLGAFALATVYGIPTEKIVKGIENYVGVDRRFQQKGEFDGVKVVDDYAHHPTEISATISSARACRANKLWIAFQPHTYTRTHDLLDEFALALKEADNVIVTDIYAAREKDTGLVHSKDLVDKINNAQGNATAYYKADFETAKAFLQENCNAGDMLITMGAGDIYKLGEMLVK